MRVNKIKICNEEKLNEVIANLEKEGRGIYDIKFTDKFMWILSYERVC